MMDLQWKYLKTSLPDSIAAHLQNRAYKKNMFSLIKPIYLKYHDLDGKFAEWSKIYAPKYAPSENGWDLLPMRLSMKRATEDFFRDWEKRPEVHSSYIKELFNFPEDFNDAIAFSTKQAQIQIDIMKKNLAIIVEAKENKTHELEHRFKMAIQFQGLIGNTISLLHDLNNIKALNGRKRADAVTDLLVAVSWSINDYRLKLPKDIRHHLKEYEPFSLNWMYAKFRMIEYAAAGSCLAFKSTYERHRNFMQTQDSLTFLAMSRLILALKPFSSKFCQDHFPYIVFDRFNDEQYMADARMTPCMNEQLSYYSNYRQSRIKIQPKSAERFFKEILPMTFERCQKTCGITCFRPLTESEMKRLLAGGKKKARRTVNSLATNEAVVEFEMAKDSASSSSSYGTSILYSSAAEDGQPDSKAQVNSEPRPIEESIAAREDRITRAPKFKEPFEKATPKTKSAFEGLFKKHVIEVEIDETLKDEWEAEHQRELARYSEIKNLPESTSEDVAQSFKRFKLIDIPPKKQISFVASWSTNDFLDLFPRAREVYYDNVARNTAARSIQDKSMKFCWVFDPSIVIDVKTFKFLCKVFGLLTGRSELRFSNFQRAFMALTHGSTDKSKKNSTVFRFNHQFELDGKICVPPIGGVHPEHLSSRFNHVQIRAFLEHGGAHPYFFEEIWNE